MHFYRLVVALVSIGRPVQVSSTLHLLRVSVIQVVIVMQSVLDIRRESRRGVTNFTILACENMRTKS